MFALAILVVFFLNSVVAVLVLVLVLECLVFFQNDVVDPLESYNIEVTSKQVASFIVNVNCLVVKLHTLVGALSGLFFKRTF